MKLQTGFVGSEWAVVVVRRQRRDPAGGLGRLDVYGETLKKKKKRERLV